MPQFDTSTWLETLVYLTVLMYLFVVPTTIKTTLTPDPYLRSVYTFENLFWTWP